MDRSQSHINRGEPPRGTFERTLNQLSDLPDLKTSLNNGCKVLFKSLRSAMIALSAGKSKFLFRSNFLVPFDNSLWMNKGLRSFCLMLYLKNLIKTTFCFEMSYKHFLSGRGPHLRLSRVLNPLS